MLTRKQFKDVMGFVMRQQKRDRKLEIDLQSYTGDKDFTGWHTDSPSTIVRWLEKEMDDESGYISWWLWDAPDQGRRPSCCTVTERDGTEWKLTTLTKLYTFLKYNYLTKHPEPLPGAVRLGREFQRESVKLTLHEIDKLMQSNEKNNSSNSKYHEYNALFQLVRSRIENEYRAVANDFESSFDPETCARYEIFMREGKDE